MLESNNHDSDSSVSLQIPDEIVAWLESYVPFEFEQAEYTENLFIVDCQLLTAETRYDRLYAERNTFADLVTMQFGPISCMPYLEQLYAHMSHNIDQMESEVLRLIELRDRLKHEEATYLASSSADLSQKPRQTPPTMLESDNNTDSSLQIPEEIVAWLENYVPFEFEPPTYTENLFIVNCQLLTADTRYDRLYDERDMLEDLVLGQIGPIPCMPYLEQLHTHMSHTIDQMASEVLRLTELRDRLNQEEADYLGQLLKSCHL